jgi:2-dehydropantoate 2-reductase
VKVCIFGAGAIGGHIGAILSLVGVDVTLIARGPHLAELKKDGLKLTTADGAKHHVHLACTDDPAEAGIQDYVIVTLKAPSVAGVVAPMQPLLGPDTAVVTAMNGIPWWYFYRLAGPFEDRGVDSVDPGRRIWEGIGPERAIGCVVWTAAEIVSPGVIAHIYGDRVSLGEPDGSRSDRAVALSQRLIEAGLRSPVRPNIRNEIWMKLWGNLSFNPLSALTHATLDTIAADPRTRAIVRAMMVEARAVGEQLGVKFSMDVDTRIEGAAEVGAHRTSMLQDLEKGRAMEIEALVGVVAEMGRLADVATPTIDTVYALVVQRAREAGCYPA